MDIGGAVIVGRVSVGAMITVWVSCEVSAATVPVGFCSIVWIGKPGLLGRLHAERMVAIERDINRSLNVFNFAFLILMKI